MVNPNKPRIQGEDGGWKLEERELEEKRRSLEGQREVQREMQKDSPRNESFEKKDDGTSPRSGEKPPQVPPALPFFDHHIFLQIVIFCNRRKLKDERRSRAGRRKLREVVRL